MITGPTRSITLPLSTEPIDKAVTRLLAAGIAVEVDSDGVYGYTAADVDWAATMFDWEIGERAARFVRKTL